MGRIKILIFAFLFVFTSCQFTDRNTFSLRVNHYNSGAGISIIYLINEKGLRVDTDCDLANCKQETVYTQIFNASESDSVFNFINNLRLDTLKKLYKPAGMFCDGQYTEVRLKRGLFSSHKSAFDNISTATTDTLFAYIDNLIHEKKYRLSHWGESE